MKRLSEFRGQTDLQNSGLFIRKPLILLERVKGNRHLIENRQQTQIFQRLAEFGYNLSYNQFSNPRPRLFTPGRRHSVD